MKKELKKMLSESTNDLEKYVIDDLLEEDEPKTYLKDLLNHGCVSGMVSGLIYYEDTHKFYNEFADEIDELKEEIEESMGEPLKINGDVRNFLAWFGYEEMARKVAKKLNIEF